MRLDIIDRDYEPASIKEPFSVCMTVRNEAEGIVRFLASLFAQTLQPYEVVIVDGGSEDDTCRRIREFREYRINLVEVTCSPAGGRNLASKAARHELQVMVDAGTLLDPRLLANLVGPLAEGADVASGIYRPIIPSRYSGYFIPDWNNHAALKSNFLPSCRCAAVRRALVNAVGGFREDLKQRWGEDSIFMLRARELSKRWALNRNAIVEWQCPSTLDESKDLAFKYGMGNGEINDDRYFDPVSVDPVIQAAAEGFRRGCALRLHGRAGAQ